MRRLRTLQRFVLLPSMVFILGLYGAGSATEPNDYKGANPNSGIQLAQQPDKKEDEKKKREMPPTAPPTEVPSPTPSTAPPTAAPGGGPSSLLGNVGGELGSLPTDRQSIPTGPSNVIGPGETVGRVPTDAGDLIGRSLSGTGIETQRRSPIANEARIRGQRLGQIVTHADGAFWFPARLDLDTFLSKIDSGIVQDIIILRGPYSARYGPGLSFIDIATLGSPRSREGEGLMWEGRTFSTYRTNGEQLYGRQGLGIQSETWGMRASYGHRTGNDYEAGDGREIPSSYNARDVDFVFGLDLSPDSRFEFGYLRLDQTNLEFPGQIFDTTFLITNGFRLRYVLEDQYYFDKFTVEGYYNRTSMAGNAQGAGKRLQIPQLTALGFTGFTDIDQSSAGYRAYFTWGQRAEPQFTLGTDFRYLKGQLNEFDEVIPIDLPCFSVFNFPIPRSHQSDVGGLFAEYLLPVEDRFVFRTGVRGDYARTDVDSLPPGYCPEDFFGMPGMPGIAQMLYGTTDLENDWRMLLAYATAEYKLTPAWTIVGGFGHAQRPPTTTELYALQPFLAVLQQGFTTVIGNPQLATEKLWQMDLGLKVQAGDFRAGVNGFYSFIEDYITYQTRDPEQGILKLEEAITEAKTVQFVNTGLATLSGFELFGEYDLTDWMTPFVTMSFVEGRDHTRDERGQDNDLPADTE